MLKKPAFIATVLGVVIFSAIYFGLDTKPSEQRSLEKSRVSNLEATGIQNILTSARDSLSKEQLNYLEALNEEVRSSLDDSLKMANLKRLSGVWYEQGFPILSGYYAEEIAKLSNTHEAWSVAGTTYILGMREAKVEDQRQFSRSRAIRALESAISIEPDNVSDQINLALIYVEAPDKNPMQGILMLRDLNEKYPNSVQVLNQLGRLAIQTNQSAKALERLTRSFEIDSENRNTICLLATAYKQAGDSANASKFQIMCENILKNNKK